MNETESRNLRDSIVEGLDKSFQKLVLEKKRTNSMLVFADRHGEIVKVKAVDI